MAVAVAVVIATVVSSSYFAAYLFLVNNQPLALGFWLFMRSKPRLAPVVVCC